MVLFTLYKRGTRIRWDVSTASAIALEAQHGDLKFIIPASALHPDADWNTGRVAVVLSPSNVAAIPNTYQCVLTITMGGEVITLPHIDTFPVEVYNRPAYPYP